MTGLLDLAISAVGTTQLRSKGNFVIQKSVSNQQVPAQFCRKVVPLRPLIRPRILITSPHELREEI